MVGGRLLGDAGRGRILRVTTHSAQVERGDLFVALDGRTSRGCEHYREAIDRGAAAILIQEGDPLPLGFSVIISKNKRINGAEITNAMLGDPLARLRFVGITGTKGKTSTLAMIGAQMLAVGENPLCVGTLGLGFWGEMQPLLNTTPDLYFLLPYFSHYLRRGVRTVLAEVSSQALADGRLDGVRIPMGVFTGFSADHIGPREHASLCEYYAAKRRLFGDFGVEISVAPMESEHACDITRGVPKRLFSSLRVPSDLTLNMLDTSPWSSHFSYREKRYRLSLGGRCQLLNASLSTLASSELLGLPPESLLGALSHVRIPGRMECYRLYDALFIIDYAHNGESLRAVCEAARPFCRGRMIVLLGSVGGRAECRRRDLVRGAEALCDLVVLTEDDSDTEDREQVLTDLFSYAVDKDRFCIIPDRREAVESVCRMARAGDTVLLLGKGHEQFLVRGGARIPFRECEILISYGAEPISV